jgi:hypothetical protein
MARRLFCYPVESMLWWYESCIQIL